VSVSGRLDSRSSVVVVGASTAGVAAVETLRADGYTGRLVLADKQLDRPYYRPALSKEYLTGELTADEICTLSEARSRDLGIDLMLGSRASSLDCAKQTIMLGSERLSYDGLLITTGARARMPTSFKSLPGVHTLRTFDDARRVAREMSTMRPRVAIVGGGFIGCEIAAAARSHGLAVTIVESEPRLLQRVLTQELADSLINLHQDHDVTVMCGNAVTAVLGETRARGLSLADGSAVDADLIVVGVGTVPEIEWLAGSSVELDDGILTTPSLRTTVDNVYAAGDIVRWTTRKGRYSRRSEHWAAARAQGELAARNLLTGCDEAYAHAEYGWSDQYDRQFQMIGSFGSRVELVLGDGRDGPYVALSGDRNIVTGAIALDYHNAFKRARVLVANRSTWHQCFAQQWQKA